MAIKESGIRCPTSMKWLAKVEQMARERKGKI